MSWTRAPTIDPIRSRTVFLKSRQYRRSDQQLLDGLTHVWFLRTNKNGREIRPFTLRLSRDPAIPLLPLWLDDAVTCLFICRKTTGRLLRKRKTAINPDFEYAPARPSQVYLR